MRRRGTMYLRWKKTPLAAGQPYPPILGCYYPCGVPRKQRPSHRAYPVESARVAGDPKQRVVAYLAACKDDGFDDPRLRERFWQTVLPRLDALDLDTTTREHLIAQMQERVR